MTPENSHSPFAPWVIELDGANGCAERAEPVSLLCYRSNVDCAHVYSSLQAADGIVPAHLNLPRTKELPPLQIQPEDLAKA